MVPALLPLDGRHDCRVRDEVLTLVQRGQLPNENVGDEDFWRPWELAVRALPRPARDDEALAVLDVLPAGEDSAYGLAWEIVHFVDSRQAGRPLVRWTTGRLGSGSCGSDGSVASSATARACLPKIGVAPREC
jgi:hypothetical protein